MVFVCLLVGWLVCQQDYTKTTERIYSNFGWRMGLCPEYNPNPTMDSNAADGRPLDELLFRVKEIVLTFFNIVRESVLRVILLALDKENEVYHSCWYQASTI